MSLHTAQLISLICNYNNYIKNGNIPRDYLDSNVFENCETVGYILLRNYVNRVGLDGDIVAANPVKWFRYLEKDGCLKLSLHYRLPTSPKLKDSRTPNSLKGSLYIEAVYDKYSNFWFCRWFKQKESLGGENWNVRYYLAYRFEDTIDEKVSLQKARNRLHDVLQKSISFASDNDFLQWADIFSIAFNVLNSPEPQTIFAKSGLIENDASLLQKRQVLYATLIAFISPDEDLWQVKPSDTKKSVALTSLTEKFYGALIASLIATANTQA
ncbi:hypothetical protein IDJ77_26380 [Mucilaginibacter sp. ZT4R22]|uniref:Uncharacterized protein n=1 Tax=Mucilaginibacter pankratovii TaxID=2772110 RepID=A0ABR7X1F7_9SPHI|nr:hypothetical protein [Mucilaginibacter pankratovii]MBD1367367.1 hypothetical protein [Mucilaginibacter pankratovii]